MVPPNFLSKSRLVSLERLFNPARIAALLWAAIPEAGASDSLNPEIDTSGASAIIELMSTSTFASTAVGSTLGTSEGLSSVVSDCMSAVALSIENSSSASDSFPDGSPIFKSRLISFWIGSIFQAAKPRIAATWTTVLMSQLGAAFQNPDFLGRSG